jgi:hypothetical protein
MYQMPTWLLAVLIIGTVVGLSLLGLLATRKVAAEHFKDDDGTVGFYASIVGIVYALLLGMIAVTTWESNGAVRDLASREAMALNNLWRGTIAFSEPAKTAIRSDIKTYIQTVIDVEFPNAEKAQQADQAGVHLASLVEKLNAYEPKTPGDEVRYGTVMMTLNDLLIARRLRLLAAEEAIPGMLWAVMILGTFVTMGLCFFLSPNSPVLHYVLTLGMAVVFGATITLIVAMDHPLWGEVAVKPDVHKAVLEHVMK